MVEQLIFDIGMHNGDDTEYYLHKGYRVVAVEANPVMWEKGRTRFAREISSGALTLRNVGITETEGKMDFWASTQTEWSSFHEENATKGGATATKMIVPTMPFKQLLAEEGTPFFVKIDIEMNDSLCLVDLAATESRPAYLSIESNVHADTDIKLLNSIGYESFKCVRQNDFRNITPRNVVYQQELRRGLANFGRLPKPANRIAHPMQRLHYRKNPVDGWSFKNGSSGPISVELPGRWLTADQMLSVWHQLIAYDLRLSAGGLGEWFDVHAMHRTAQARGE